MDADEVDEDLGNLSFGSTGAFHESRHLCTLVPFINSFLHLVLLNVIKMRDDDGFGHPKTKPDFIPVTVIRVLLIATKRLE